MKVLHDWDRLELEGGWAKRRSISLFLYCLVRNFNFLKFIKYFRENAERIEAEQLAYMETLIKLNELCKVNMIFGIRDQVHDVHGEEIDRLAKIYRLDVRRHIHIGKNHEEDRIRSWLPPLPDQTKNSWHFDTKLAKGEKIKLKKNERPIFHVDRPFHLALYIDHLHEVINPD